MAELPDLGEHCALSDCNQLDFLPLVCPHCQVTFCRRHLSAEQHHCDKVPEPAKADLTAAAPSFPCHVSGCGGAELAPVVCSDCSLAVCLAHRHGSEHDCAVWQERLAEQQQQADASSRADAIQAARLAAQPAVAEPRSQRARKTAVTVQLMRLKQRATGDGAVPLADRHYLLLLGPGGRGVARPVYISRRWTLGRAVDALADMCGAKNENDRTGGRQLRLFRRPDGGCVASVMDQVIADFLPGQMDNGETVVLEYCDTEHVQRDNVS